MLRAGTFACKMWAGNYIVTPGTTALFLDI